MSLELEATVRDIAVARPQVVRVFESFGIEYGSGGMQSLEDACRQANVPVAEVRDAVERPLEAEMDAGEDWTTASLEELSDHIVKRHHTFVRQETARLLELLAKVGAKHKTNHPELDRLEDSSARWRPS